MRFQVWMRGRSLIASYDVYVDVVADNDEEAAQRAKREPTKPTGAFFNWSPSMFSV